MPPPCTASSRGGVDGAGRSEAEEAPVDAGLGFTGASLPLVADLEAEGPSARMGTGG